MQKVEEILLGSPEKSVWNTVLEQNTYDKELLIRVINGKLTKKYFKEHASERFNGENQFGIKTYNIRLSSVLCKHDCKYCYIGPMFRRWKKQCDVIDMESLMPSDPVKVNKKWRKVKNEKRSVYFFPSSSDIFVENAESYVKACISMMKAGHEIMFVTKPTLKSINAIILEFEKSGFNYKNNLIVFVTISSDDDVILRNFEPNTSLFAERIEVLKYLANININVNVMMEPYLTDPVRLISKFIDILPEKGIVAIGKMNYTPVMMFDNDLEKDKSLKEYLKNLYSKSETEKLWNYVKLNPKIFLKKESIKSVLSFS